MERDGRGPHMHCVSGTEVQAQSRAQAAVSPLGVATDGSGMDSAPMSWMGGFQPLFPWQWDSLPKEKLVSTT